MFIEMRQEDGKYFGVLVEKHETGVKSETRLQRAAKIERAIGEVLKETNRLMVKALRAGHTVRIEILKAERGPETQSSVPVTSKERQTDGKN